MAPIDTLSVTALNLSSLGWQTLAVACCDSTCHSLRESFFKLHLPIAFVDSELQAKNILSHSRQPFQLVFLEANASMLELFQTALYIRDLTEGQLVSLVGIIPQANLCDSQTAYRIGMNAVVTRPIIFNELIETLQANPKPIAYVNNFLMGNGPDKG